MFRGCTLVLINRNHRLEIVLNVFNEKIVELFVINWIGNAVLDKGKQVEELKC